ncbi:MAG: sulfite exporter TauE/SafE family protein [Rhodospirillales bacterium]|nr:sulfite exporter TauE/SafE family protein [Rhodospirillales bacterium]MCB9995426.1 sulfite exporter TauE/SafE family protein [Rhodospirillales bacterium]
MQVYLPIAEMAVSAESILLLGALVGFLSGVFGVGGGFLTTPFLIFMGLPPAVAVGTQASQLVAASFSGVLGHWKRGNVDVKLGTVMMGGSMVGSIIGVMVFRLLQHIGQIDLAIPILYVGLLGTMGIMMLVESITAAMKKGGEEKERSRLYHHPLLLALPYKMRFPQSKIYVSVLVPGGIGFLGGLLVSIMGIGGGFLLVPAMIYILGMPTMLVAGTSLFQILFTTMFATIMHAFASHTVDLVLAGLLIVSGVIGVQFGVRMTRKIKGVYARIFLSLLLLLVSIELAGELVIKPVDIYTTEVR